MTVAVGTYVGTATLIERLGGTAAMGTSDNALLQRICDAINGYIEDITGRVLSPIATGTVTFDILEPSQVIFSRTGNALASGIRAITSVEVASVTGGSYTTLPATDYYLRPAYPAPGWPYTELWLSDVTTGGFSVWPEGFATVRVVCTRGWAEQPEDIEDLAERMAVKEWHARLAGQADRIGTDEMGQPLVSANLAKRDRDLLFRYTLGAFSA